MEATVTREELNDVIAAELGWDGATTEAQRLKAQLEATQARLASMEEKWTQMEQLIMRAVEERDAALAEVARLREEATDTNVVVTTRIEHETTPEGWWVT